MNSAEWFNRLEAVLYQDAVHAGILEHGTMIGNVREFITRRVLQSFLPPVVHFGTGKVIDSEQNDSRQIDIILFDGTFPHFSSHGIAGLYPAEGVLATLEIKSSFGKDKLMEAFENCCSVSSRVPHTGFERTLEEMKDLYIQKGMDPDDAHERRLRDTLIPTYIFSFHGPSSAKVLGNSIAEWIRGSATSGRGCKTVFLPRLIVAGKLVAVLNDGLFLIERDREPEHLDKKVLYYVAETPHQFGWLATHLIATVSERLGDASSRQKRSRIGSYLPIQSYIPELLASQNCAEVAISKRCSQPQTVSREVQSEA